MGKDVEEVAASLVREYLSRKGLKKTIACLEEELPRTNLSINNRSDLRKILHLEALYKKNKSEEQPLKSMLEIMVKERLRNSVDAKRCPLEDHKTLLAEQELPSVTKYARRDQDLADLHSDNFSESESSVLAQLKASPAKELHSPKRSKPLSSSSFLSASERNVFPSSSSQDGIFAERKTSKPDSLGNTRSQARRGIMSGPVVASIQETSRKRSARKSPGSFSLLNKSEYDSEGEGRLSQSVGADASHTDSDGTVPSARDRSTALGSNRPIAHSNGLGRMQRVRSPRNTSGCSPGEGALHMEVVLDDLDDEDLRGLSAVSISNTVPQKHLSNQPMDLQTAAALKELIFGSPMSCFSTEWKQQSFSFSDTPDMRYGFVQKKGGPCGVLAAVQATVLQKLLFEGRVSDFQSELQVSDAVRTKCLTEAVVEILWRAGGRKKAIVAINSGRRLFTPVGHYRSDGVLEQITCMEVESLDDLKALLEENIKQFETGPFGCALLILSAVLSRTTQGTRADMDMPTASLIGAHGYCTQELVNLLLCGRAVSNVFDDEMRLDSGNGNFTLLKGIKERCDIGLLSLFEHYNICKVGSYLKMPRFPIWVVCSESHFSVLFSACEDLASSHWKPKPFDLFYYDGLANQLEPIRLTVYPDSAVMTLDSRDVNSDLIPPLELCIRTRWPDAVVSWNETEPIL
ncbi:probable ubiquitin carboxyl-terminal hydrolase MINDY-4 isoform X2 [Electrophorus electricus]|uniref:probable ubiquitin carboxyl-terminal hydrolase MINDY-4 isoform X2 n=1 Tax=Electrophorus electricus TaxID=8005 RepID=UPI0015CFD759|nr:probable ubiquitin carboxyl-terminal hydrolase MINDY-4 isoform X2 [Electrophorus electricus]